MTVTENEDNLTFLYRTPKLEMKPLNITRIRDRYSKIFGISSEKAMEMALITKGYAFAYHALGKYVWESENHELSDDVLFYFDEALSHYVYEKIWSELSTMDRKYMEYIVTKEEIEVSEVLRLASCKPNVFSQYRKINTSYTLGKDRKNLRSFLIQRIPGMLVLLISRI